MKSDSDPFASLKQSMKLRIPDGTPDGTTKYANSNSYIKARRRAAKEERRNKIRDMLDSSLEDVNYQLPDYSDADSPIVSPLPKPGIKRKSKNLLPKSFSNLAHNKPSYQSSTATSAENGVKPSTSSRNDDIVSPMEDFLKALESSGVVENDETSCTHMMSSSSFAFNMSSDCTVFSDGLDSCTEHEVRSEPCSEEANKKLNGHNCSSGVIKDSEHSHATTWDETTYRNDAREDDVIGDESYTDGEWSVEYIDEEEVIIEEFFEDVEDASYFEEIIMDEDDKGGHDFIEEEYYSDEEVVEEIIGDCDEHCSDEEIIEESIGDCDDDGFESCSEETVVDEEDMDSYEEIIEEIIMDSDDVDHEFEEYLIEEDYHSQVSDPILEIIEEEDYNSDAVHDCDAHCKKNLVVQSSDDSYHSKEMIEGEVVEEMEYDEECYTEYEESLASSFLVENELDRDFCDYDDDSFIEEIIPEFEVPVIPAIAAWQKQQEALLAVEEEFPEVAPRTPREILMAVLAAAAMDFKLRKVPDDHKRNYTPLTVLAASLGRLMKLEEYVIEDIGRAPVVRKDDEWCPTGAPIIFYRSISLRIATEAAAMGRVMRLKENSVTNYEEFQRYYSLEEEQKVDIDDILDEKGRPIFRTSVLVPYHEREAKREVMTRDWKVGLLEESCQAGEGITVDNVQLPTKSIPRFQKPPSCSPVMSPQAIKDAIARGVAEGAWNRKYRLERPQVELRIRSMCRCQYCQHPNAFQTHAYKKLSQTVSQ